MNTPQVMVLVASVFSVSCGLSSAPGSGGSTGSANGGNTGAASTAGAGEGAPSSASSNGDMGGSANSGGGTSGSSSGGGGSPSPGGGATPPSGSSSGTAGSTGGSSGGSGGTASPDAAVNDPNTVTLTMGSFDVPAGQEIFMCQDFDNPFGGVDVAIGQSQSDMSQGSHHLHVFYGADNPPSPTVTACQNPFEFRSLLHGSGQPHLVMTYPAGTAAKLKGTLGLRFQSHYLNAGSTVLHANVVVKLTKVDPTTITNWVAELYFNRTGLSIPVGTGQQVGTTCTIPSNYGAISLIDGLSHMHSRGVHFVATTSTGVTLIDTTQWDEAPVVPYSPAIPLNPGDSITWTCTYDNNTGNVLTFGDSAQKNEMCIYLARFTSAPDGNDIECQSPSAYGTGAVTNNVP